MNRKKVMVSTSCYWDRLTTFAFESKYSLDPSRLTTILHNEVISRNHRRSIKVIKKSDRYRVSFGHTDRDNVEEKIGEILEILSAHEGKIDRALELEAAKGLLSAQG